MEKIPEPKKPDSLEGKEQQEQGIGGKLTATKEQPQSSLLNEGLQQGITNFSASALQDMIIKNFHTAKHLFGESFLREITGYDPKYLERNLKIPEFQRKIKEQIEEKIEQLEDEGLIDEEGKITEKGYIAMGLELYVEELNHLVSNNFFLGEKFSKQKQFQGDIHFHRPYHYGDSYKAIDVKKTVIQAIRHGKQAISSKDFIIAERQAKGNIEIIYALDSSGSMKGKKLAMAKKAGIALGFMATEHKDKIGLVVFTETIKDYLPPTQQFPLFLQKIARTRPLHQTNIPLAIEKAQRLFSQQKTKKHLLLLSDLEPTVGNFPIKETLQAMQRATAEGISISLVGIQLSKEAKQLARRIIDITQGKLYLLKHAEALDQIVLEDYYYL